MKKPVPVQRQPCLDYHQCEAWVEKKLGKTLRDYAGNWQGEEFNSTVPYQDFWHYVIQTGDYIHNGCYFWLQVRDESDELPLEVEPWQEEILTVFATEFSEYVDDDGSIHFWVDWCRRAGE